MSILTRRSFVQIASASTAAMCLPLQSFAGGPDVLVPANVCGQWGFVDDKATMKIEARYEAAFGFASDLAAVAGRA